MRLAGSLFTIDRRASRFQGVLILTFTLVASASVYSQPVNDECASAITLMDGIAESFDTTTATADIEPTCVPGGPTVWYSYTAICSGTATFSLCGSSYDTRIAIFDGSVGCGGAAELACNDDACFFQSELAVQVSAGTQLYAQVGGFLGEFGPGTITVTCGVPTPDCQAADNGSGTISLPPPCEYLTGDQVHMIIAGLPPGSVVEVDVIHGDFAGVIVTPGGMLGGQIEQFDSTLTLAMQGTGALSGFARSITVPAPVEIHTAPTQPGQPVQTFNTEMVALSAGLTGDPDFDLLQITAGANMGLASPGGTTLTESSPGIYEVDSFFYVHYHIDFVGAPTGLLAGLSGSTNAIAVISTPGLLPNPLTEVMSGNLNADGNVDLGDVISLLSGLFPPTAGPLGGVTLSECPAAFDCNSDDLVNIADPIYLLSWLFSGGPPLPAWGGPAPSCGAAGLVLGCLFPGTSCP